jgi:multimeric flavodoxin WrbA
VSAPPCVAAVVGSPRRDGNTAVAVAAAAGELAAAGARCETIVLGDRDVRYCLGHDECEDWEECPIADDAEDILARMWAADGVIVGSPVYGGTMSGQLKVLFDRSCHRYNHRVKLRATVLGLLAVSAETGLDETLEALEHVLVKRFAAPPLIVRARGLAMYAGDAARNAELLADARSLGRVMAEALGLRSAG